MTTEEILLIAGIAVLVLIVLALVAWFVTSRKRKRQERLRSRYGREYDATIDAKGERAGLDDLDHRERERADLSLRQVDDATRDDLRERMTELQFRFVEDPSEVMLEAQRVVTDGLRARGFPVAEDRERALRLLSVDHPDETPALRDLLDGNYGKDVGHMRTLFLDARAALMTVVEVSYSRRDLERSRSAGTAYDEADGRHDRGGHDRGAHDRPLTAPEDPGDVDARPLDADDARRPIGAPRHDDDLRLDDDLRSPRESAPGPGGSHDADPRRRNDYRR